KAQLKSAASSSDKITRSAISLPSRDAVQIPRTVAAPAVEIVHATQEIVRI
ncbi:MAG: hypothetical protein ACI8XO_003714, partial [Verrucomicrobiales bacterium]